MWFVRPAAILGAAGALHCASALLVAEDSPCEIKCGNVLDATTSDDIVCRRGDYESASAGIIFEQCVNCEASSTYTRGARLRRTSDLSSMLCTSFPMRSASRWRCSSVSPQASNLLYADNMRYATAYCLFGDPDNDALGSSPCITRYGSSHF